MGSTLAIDDLWTLARERDWRLVRWLEPRADGGVVGAEMATAGALVTLTLVLRSQVSLDVIYFQF